MDSRTDNHVRQQLANADAWVEGWTHDIAGRELPSRYMIIKTRLYVEQFMSGKGTKRWVIVPGLRGVGKTTLLAQQYKYVRDKFGEQVHLLHLSMHDVVNVVGSNLQSSIESYERIIGSSIESVDRPIFLFLDEVQEDRKWAEVLFSLHERTRKLFIVCSGSSAIYLKKNANMVRRANFEPLYPLNYTEYQLLRYSKTPIQGLKKDLKQAVFLASSAEDSHTRITWLLPSIQRYRAKIDATTFPHFMQNGSLPFLIYETNPAQVYNGIISLIDRIENEDLANGFNFDAATLRAVKPLLFLLADSDVRSRDKLAQELNTIVKLDQRVVGALLDALVQTELLIEVPARGSVSVAVTKPKKYLFMSPAIRTAFYQIAGHAATDETRKGRLLEDLVGLYMYREFVTKKLAHFTYNAGKGQSDFMLQNKSGSRIPMEVGLGKKDTRQVLATMKEVKCAYGIVLSSSPLAVDKVNNILYLPLHIFYLM